MRALGEVDKNIPQISEETKREIAKFFMKTSIPRILAEKKKLAEHKLSK